MTIKTGNDSLKTRRSLQVDGKEYHYYSLDAAKDTLGDISRLPYSLKVVLENLLRFEDDRSVSLDDIKAVGKWLKDRTSCQEISFRPARVLLQDFTGVPGVADLAAMRDAMIQMGADPQKINPLSPVDLVIDHSVSVDDHGTNKAFGQNVQREFMRNQERYEFLRWGQQAFDNFRVVPPGTGICHQVNLEYLSKVVWHDVDQNGETVIYPDTLVGADSHTTMVNGLGVLGWGVGGIEAEAVMLGQPISMVIPDVVGFRLTGAMREGLTATDLVLRIVEMLREKGVVAKFVEFFGSGVQSLSLADRATIANMAPEYGATCGIFPVDAETLSYLRFTARPEHEVKIVEAFAKAQGMFVDENTPDPVFSDELVLDLGTVEPALAGPKRPQDRVLLSEAATSFDAVAASYTQSKHSVKADGADYDVDDGAVVLAAITSCTNTSNPSVLIGAGLVAKRAHELGLETKPWVKTSLAPGSQVVTDYLNEAGLQEHLNALGFHLVGYGCTSCIGNSGPLKDPVTKAINDGDLTVCAVLSGNRNFEGRVHPLIKANYLASPMLVVAYALAGSMKLDLFNDALGNDKDGNPVYLKDIWPSNKEIQTVLHECLKPAMFKERYGNVFVGSNDWQAIEVGAGDTFEWKSTSTYVQRPPFFEDMPETPEKIGDIKGARILAMLGDSITTDHISPAGSFTDQTPAGGYLLDHQVARRDFNSYGSRRGNHQVMMRGTFANIRIRNEMIPGVEGGFTKIDGKVMPIYEAAMLFQAQSTPTVIIGGKEYGTGSSRDWAAKGTKLLGISAVLVESFERIHRSNLIGMGVLPLEFPKDVSRTTLGLQGSEKIDINGIEDKLEPKMQVGVTITYDDGSTKDIKMLCRIDTLDELDYYLHGGILHYVLRSLRDAA